MYLSDGWQDFAVLDAGGGNKLERWRDAVLLRPDPQAVWPMDNHEAEADAVYLRAATGGGHWEFRRDLPESWRIRYRNLTFLVRPTGFKHTGLFPEQAVNWDWMAERLAAWKGAHPGQTPRVLNLFGYTGGATVACAASGASVVHVDAAKGMVAWAKDNARESGLSDAPIRYIVDDCVKFVKREQRRGNRYEAIVMDPPSYGRGPDGELWKIENDLYPLLADCVQLLSDAPAFLLINSYTTGLAASVLCNALRVALPNAKHIESDEVGLPIARDKLVLPCGASGRATF